MDRTGLRAGVLAVQGDFEAHARALASLGANAVLIKHPTQLEEIAALILPGGESTTFLKSLEQGSFLDQIRTMAAQGLPVFGTCAGAILLAREISNSGQARLGLIDISIQRNAYGRQLASFIDRSPVRGLDGDIEMVFIRAPIIERVGLGVEVLAECRGRPVLVRQGNVLAATFHPELTADRRIHALFLDIAGGRAADGCRKVSP